MQSLFDTQQWLYNELDTAKKLGILNEFLETPKLVAKNLNPKFVLRDYQKDAFARFFYYLGKYPQKETPIHLLYNMATGSGKTLIMAGLILYLYKQGYRNFLFFVNSTNIIEKTKDNFLNNQSSKYLFNQKIQFQNKEIFISKVDNFEGVHSENINICFTTIQKLHSDLHSEKENALTFDDFENKKIVLLADEAHHGQAQTKQMDALDKKIENPSWENTVLKIFSQNKENMLLEFTATMDFLNKKIEKKYISKVIYKYDLKQFRNDRFSKDVEILRSDTDKKGRILLALVLNQYRQDIAGKHRINLKPVILFKSHRTIAESKENQEFFHHLIENLAVQELEELRERNDIPEIKRAFAFFENEGSWEQLIQKLQRNFAENKCIGMNEESELEQNQIFVNSLENRDNQIRAIFTVNKLNEGWDVLNLFDIVRLDEGQAGGGKTKGIAKSTISEAQLVGRGARYFPFVIKEQEEERFLRKFDNNQGDELRILEELHFHSPNEHRYISELKQALVEQGIMDDETEVKELTLKDSFKKTEFYRQGSIFKNKKIAKDYSNIKSFADLGMLQKDFDYEIPTGRGKITDVFTEENYDNFVIKDKESKTLAIGELERHIVKNALARKEFFCFANIKKYFPKLQSVNEIIENREFLNDIGIRFTGKKEDTENLSNENKFKAVVHVLDEIEEKLKNNITDYQGTEIFYPQRVYQIFTNKKLKIEIGSERAAGQEEFVGQKDWYAFNANYGTDEEKACVEFMDRLIEEDFKSKYKEIYLLRNEMHFTIHNFADGQGFAPDFVLFLKDKKGKKLSYQIFIEPKGKHIAGTDDWKNEFLKKIRGILKGFLYLLFYQ